MAENPFLNYSGLPEIATSDNKPANGNPFRVINQRLISEANLDKETGAPASVRERVGSGPEADRLANLQLSYPKARKYGDDNFIFDNPETGRPTLYNPEGLDWGDVASVGSEIAEGVGGAVSGVGAFVAGGMGLTPASYIAAPLAAGAGATAGSELYREAASWFRDTKQIDSRDAMDKLLDAAKTFAVNAGGQALIPGGGIALKELGKFSLKHGSKITENELMKFLVKSPISKVGLAAAVTGGMPLETLTLAMGREAAEQIMMKVAKSDTIKKFLIQPTKGLINSPHKLNPDGIAANLGRVGSLMTAEEAM